MDAERRAGHRFQDHTICTSGKVERARLNPNILNIGYPETLVVYLDVGNKVASSALVRLEAIAETAKFGDRHMFFLF
jgi:hypothetical protein